MATPRHPYCLLLVLHCCLLQPTAAKQSGPVGEVELLLQIKHAWGDPSVLSAWSAATSATGAHCRWPYVACDSAGRVRRLALAIINVTGPVPDAVGGLSALTHLDLSNNSIVGTFQTALYRCSSLRYLDLSFNNIGGELPHDIGHGLSANLRALVLSFNNFNGSIPASLSRLRNLRHLELDSNSFTGTIPTKLGELSSLRTLLLNDNSFDPGKLPASFKNMTKLVSLGAGGCGLIGNFPSYVVMNMTELESLVLAENLLTGSLPPDIWRLNKLEFLTLHNNSFSGEIPTSISRLPSLTILYLGSNMFTGTLPPELGKHSPGLFTVAILDNKLTGGIPEWLCAHGNFRYFHASNNHLNGSIPISLARCTTLKRLELNSNQISGEIPAELGYNTPWLLGLDLGNNQLSGEIPPNLIYDKPLLQKLNLASNKLSGKIG